MEFVIDGQRAHVATGGADFDPALPSVIFVHGAAMDHTAWALQSRYFAHHGRNVLAVDLPGHGKSEGAPPASIEGYADWLLKLMDAAGLERAALVGHSLGALACLEAAGRAPDRITALALLGVAYPMVVADGFLASAKANDHAAIEMMMDWSHARPSHMGGAETPGLWMIGGAMRLVERAAPGVMHAGLKACNDYGGGLAAAERVTCPVRLILGAKDMMTPPRASKDLAARLGRAETIVIPDCGHMMMVEAAEAVRGALKGFI